MSVTGRNLSYNRLRISQGPVFGVAPLAPPRKPSGTAPAAPGAEAGVYLAATSDARLVVVEGDTATDLPCPPTVTPGRQGAGYLGLAYDPTSRTAITGSFDGTARAWRINWEDCEGLASLPVRRLKGILADRGVSAVGCLEKPDLVRRIQVTGALPPAEDLGTLPGHTGTVVSCAVQGDFAATVGNDGTARLWALREPEAPDTPTPGRAAEGDTVSPSAARRARAQQWAAQQTRHRSLAVLPAHGEGVDSIALHPAAGAMLTGGKDGCVKVWDVTAAAHRCTGAGRAAALADGTFEQPVEPACTATFEGLGSWVWCVASCDTGHPGLEDVGSWVAAQPPVVREVLAGTAGGVLYCCDARVPTGPVAATPLGPGVPVAGLVTQLSHHRILASCFDAKVYLLDSRKWAVVEAAPIPGVEAPSSSPQPQQEIRPFWSGHAARQPMAGALPSPVQYTFTTMYTIATASERLTRLACFPGGGAAGCFDGSVHTFTYTSGLW